MNRFGLLGAVLAASTLSLSGCTCHKECCQGGESHHEKEGEEVPVAMTDLPPAVRATLERESAGGNVREIERELRNGTTAYSADVELGGAMWDITIAEDGSLVSKVRDDDDDHDDDDDADDDND